MSTLNRDNQDAIRSNPPKGVIGHKKLKSSPKTLSKASE